MVCGSPFTLGSRFPVILLCIIFVVRVTGFAIDAPSSADDLDLFSPSSSQSADRQLLRNCTPPTIQDFPNDFFTQQQRLQGHSVLNF